MSGETAQKAMARGIARSPFKDGRTWILRTVTVSDPGSILEQPDSDIVDTPIDPVVAIINEFEAGHLGQNIRAGDLRLIVEGSLDITDQTMLLCDGEKVDIIWSKPSYQDGVIQEYRLYVRRAPED